MVVRQFLALIPLYYYIFAKRNFLIIVTQKWSHTVSLAIPWISGLGRGIFLLKVRKIPIFIYPDVGKDSIGHEEATVP